MQHWPLGKTPISEIESKQSCENVTQLQADNDPRRKIRNNCIEYDLNYNKYYTWKNLSTSDCLREGDAYKIAEFHRYSHHCANWWWAQMPGKIGTKLL